MSAFSILRGERINGLLLGNDSWTLVVRTVGGKYFRFDTDNDCCNSVWFNHVNGVNILGEGNSFDLIRGALVTEVEAKGFEPQENEDAGEVIEDAFITIRTDRGYLDLEVRNSHNGYYGGSISYNDDPDLTSISDLLEITEDF